ncbi:MAG TPA: DNA-processing protein DprA [Thiobacillaceae bacterium]|nr:DNA-processing protein DprA [Thiobacillaceae bacterium]HNA83120.1 DNA-processing protein DprA [Thiobacillaceae bacterium]HNH89505.1 DNA-processing protein DprA [Thiobacillaceae bacterium]HNI06987.1 DNA-processing protein DprA [Thiobacillaceae bacterium]
MPRPADAAAWLGLDAIPGLGPEAAFRLLTAFATPEAALGAGIAQLAPVVGDTLARAIHRGVEPAAIAPGMEWLAGPDNHLVTWFDAAYPARLRDIPSPPAWLYVRGDPDWLARPMLAIVGSRHATPQGLRDARAFAQSLSDAGLTVVSGLALGVDAAAHEGGLAGLGSSVAVVGTGLDRIYPARNKALAHRLAAEGALVSEFPIGTPPKSGHFPRRNRIISGLSLGVLVVEAALESGSLITARLASEQGRDVFALPGSIHSALSKGCHQLIKQGAKLVESAADILEELGRLLPPATPQASLATGAGDILLACLAGGPLAPDQLAERLGLTVEEVSVKLLSAELEGSVAKLPGGLYQRLFP